MICGNDKPSEGLILSARSKSGPTSVSLKPKLSLLRKQDKVLFDGIKRVELPYYYQPQSKSHHNSEFDFLYLKVAESKWWMCNGKD